MRLIYFFLLLTISNLIFATDYAKQENWAALPTMQDNADWTPKGLQNLQDSAKADVFFIHPTTDVTGFKGNAAIDDKSINRQTDNFPIKYQASVFNESCKVYAPRYRQAALNNFFSKNSERSQEAFDIAYKDVKAAFEYYLKNYNNGRPIIIAGHSQGSKHAQRLLREFFDGQPLQKQLMKLIQEAHINLLPTFQNTGIKLKLLNALFNGRFCIVNSMMTEHTGLEKYCEIADDPQMMSEIISQKMETIFSSEMIIQRSALQNEFSDKEEIKKIITQLQLALPE